MLSLFFIICLCLELLSLLASRQRLSKVEFLCHLLSMIIRLAFFFSSAENLEIAQQFFIIVRVIVKIKLHA